MLCVNVFVLIRHLFGSIRTITQTNTTCLTWKLSIFLSPRVIEAFLEKNGCLLKNWFPCCSFGVLACFGFSKSCGAVLYTQICMAPNSSFLRCQFFYRILVLTISNIMSSGWKTTMLSFFCVVWSNHNNNCLNLDLKRGYPTRMSHPNYRDSPDPWIDRLCV